jgi:hypothetical protein
MVKKWGRQPAFFLLRGWLWDLVLLVVLITLQANQIGTPGKAKDESCEPVLNFV